MILAIVLAVVCAVALAYGAMLQHHGVSAASAADTRSAGRFRLAHVRSLLRSPAWVGGLLVTGLGMAANIIALAIAPVMVVQPIGAISLVVSILLAVRHRSLAVSRRMVIAVVLCIGGVAAFVLISALNARAEVQDGTEALVVGWLGLGLAVVSVLVTVLWRHPPQLLLIAGAGVLFACVATNMHIVSFQFLSGGLPAVTWSNVVSLVVSGIVGSVYVQSAYGAGPPEMVIAGLTVVDPIVAVVLGALVLGEAAGTAWPLVAAMGLTGIVACAGVVVLSRYHPDVTVRAGRNHE